MNEATHGNDHKLYVKQKKKSIQKEKHKGYKKKVIMTKA